MKYRLRSQYKLGIADGCNYILSIRDDKCVYLNPYAAFVVNRLIQGWTVNKLSELLSSINNASMQDSCHTLEAILKKLDVYLEPASDEEDIHVRSDEDNLDEILIMRQSRHFLCPVIKEKVPRKLKFYLTDYCTRRCVYCFAGAKYTEEQVDASAFLPVQRFEEIIKEAAAIGVSNIEISGGDPFIVKNIDQYLKVMIDFFPFDWGTSTKSLISKEMACKLAICGLKEMQVSIDSCNPNTVNRLLGVSNAFEEEIATIRNLMDAGIRVVTKTVITSLNILEIPETVRYLVSLGVRHMRFSYYYISANRHSDSLYPSNEQITWLNSKIPQITSFLKSSGAVGDLAHHDIYDESYRGNRVICGGFTGSMSVRYDGAVLFCDSLNHCDYFVAGNLKEQGIAAVWNSQKAKELNDPKHFKEKYRGTKCYTCNIFNNCFYKRCYVRSFQRYGNYFDVDPACPFGDENYIVR